MITYLTFRRFCANKLISFRIRLLNNQIDHLARRIAYMARMRREESQHFEDCLVAHARAYQERLRLKRL